MKRVDRLLAAGLFVLVLTLPGFAILKVINNEGDLNIVKFGEDIVVPVGARVNSVVAFGGNVAVSGSVASDIVAIGGDVLLKERAVVGGDVVAIGGRVKQGSSALVTGAVSEIALPGGLAGLSELTRTGVIRGMAFFSLLTFLGFLALTVLLVALFTPQLGVISAGIERHLLRAFLLGLLLEILFIPIVILLAVSLVGLVLIPFWAILVLLIGLFGYVAAAQFIGKRVLLAFRVRGRSMMLEALCGVTVLYLVCLIPLVGLAIKFLVWTWGAGSVVMTRFGTAHD